VDTFFIASYIVCKIFLLFVLRFPSRSWIDPLLMKFEACGQEVYAGSSRPIHRVSWVRLRVQFLLGVYFMRRHVQCSSQNPEIICVSQFQNALCQKNMKKKLLRKSCSLQHYAGRRYINLRIISQRVLENLL